MVLESQNFTPVPPDLNAWVKLMLKGFASSMNCISLATVNSFNATEQTANLTINYVRVFKNANPNLPNPAPDEQTTNVLLPYPVLVQCPVFILQGGGAYLTMPIKAGDTGLVLFNDREITTWLQTGQVLPPQNERVHDLSDGIYLGGIRSILKAIANYNTNAASLVDSTGERLLQSGMMMAYGGSSAPSGWLLCDGSSYSKTAYPLLFAAIGTNFGGSGGNFNVPDMRGQVAAGYKSGDPNFGTFGGALGEAAHVLTIPEIPPHTHLYGSAANTNAGGGIYGTSDQTDQWNTSSVGGGLGHNNIQPSLTVNWIIKI